MLYFFCFHCLYCTYFIVQCARQYPHRKEHPSGGSFPEEGRQCTHLAIVQIKIIKYQLFDIFLEIGWGGKCGNNELTCHLSGFGPEGVISFDW